MAIQSEYMQLHKLNVFEVVDGLPTGSRIVFHKKHNRYSSLLKFKAWIVAKGFSQVSSEDLTGIFSSIAKFSTLWTFFSYVAYLDWELHHINIVAVYLHGPLDKNIYITISEDIEGSGSGHYWKLKKALYGLKQARRQWEKCLHEVLTKFGFSWALSCKTLDSNNLDPLLV